MMTAVMLYNTRLLSINPSALLSAFHIKGWCYFTLIQWLGLARSNQNTQASSSIVMFASNSSTADASARVDAMVVALRRHLCCCHLWGTEPLPPRQTPLSGLCWTDEKFCCASHLVVAVEQEKSATVTEWELLRSDAPVRHVVYFTKQNHVWEQTSIQEKHGEREVIVHNFLLISFISPTRALSVITFPGPYIFSWLTEKWANRALLDCFL